MVQIAGALSPANDAVLANGTDNVAAFTLPEGFRPPTGIYALCQGTMRAVWLLRVNADGQVQIGRYRTSFDSYPSTVATSVWLPISITFMTE